MKQIGWIRKGLFGALLFLLLGTVLFAAKGSRKHEFQAKLSIVAATKGAANLAAPLDSLELPNVKIPFSVVDSRQISSDFAWAGKTAKGRSISWKLTGNGSVSSDLKSGKVDLDLPFVVTIDGQQVPVRVRFTTESSRDGFGSATGRRASFLTPLSASVDLVAGGEVTADQVNFGISTDNVPSKTKGHSEAKAAKREPVVFRITAKGQLNALDGDSLL